MQSLSVSISLCPTISRSFKRQCVIFICCVFVFYFSSCKNICTKIESPPPTSLPSLCRCLCFCTQHTHTNTCIHLMCHRGRKTTNSFVHTLTHTLSDTHTRTANVRRNARVQNVLVMYIAVVVVFVAVLAVLLLLLLFFFCTFSRRAAVRQSPVGRFLHCTLCALLPFYFPFFIITNCFFFFFFFINYIQLQLLYDCLLSFSPLICCNERKRERKRN